MYAMGLDFGSTASKGVILNDKKEIVASAVVQTGTGTSGPGRVLEALKEKSGLTKDDMDNIIVTGYGRMNFKDADRQMSELSCHAKGVWFLEPEARTIIDIGGQDAKVLKLTNTGKMLNFVMNDKCAAGTGRFLNVMATVLETEVSKLGEIDSRSTKEIAISSTCTVFAESEVISYLSTDAKTEDIVAGIHASVAGRVAGLAKRVGIDEVVVMAGGVARNTGVVNAMSRILGVDVRVPKFPQLTGALGAALFALEDALDDEDDDEDDD